MQVQRSADGATPFPRLFEPFQMGNVLLRNRIVMAGHGTRFVDQDSHHLTTRQAAYFAERARGGVGLIIQGSGMVHPTGLALPAMNEVWTDGSVASYAHVADAVHEHGTAIFGQLSHLGRQGTSFANQRELWAPSAIPDPASRQVPHAMTKREISELVDSYRRAAGHFAAAGFDGLEVYLGHGFLLCEFLSGFSNRRDDEYGGSLENRLRLPFEVIAAVRSEVPDEMPVGVRISATEFVTDGLTLEESRHIVRSLVRNGRVSFVNVTQGNYSSSAAMIPDMSFARTPFVDLARGIREVTEGVPVMAIARIITPERCEELLAEGYADFVCLVRPLIADPEFAKKAKEGRRDEIRECISCNVGCRGGPHRGLPVMCLVNPVVGFEREWGAAAFKRSSQTRRVVVVGGGPAGLKAAETAALRGHQVMLLEGTEQLGGQVLVAARAMPYRAEFANSTEQLAASARRLGVDIRLHHHATVESVLALEPDAVIVATGSTPGRPDVPGANLPSVFTAHQAITDGVDGDRVVLVDSGEADWKCLTTGERLAADGHDVLLITPVNVGAEVDVFSRPPLLKRLRGAGVEFLEYRRLTRITPASVTVEEAWTGNAETIEGINAVVVAWYGVAADELVGGLERESAVEVFAVGDCVAPRRAIDAVWDGFRVARDL